MYKTSLVQPSLPSPLLHLTEHPFNMRWIYILARLTRANFDRTGSHGRLSGEWMCWQPCEAFHQAELSRIRRYFCYKYRKCRDSRSIRHVRARRHSKINVRHALVPYVPCFYSRVLGSGIALFARIPPASSSTTAAQTWPVVGCLACFPSMPPIRFHTRL